MDDNDKKNGSSSVEETLKENLGFEYGGSFTDVGLRGRIGLIYCQMMTTTPREEWLKRSDTVLKVLKQIGFERDGEYDDFDHMYQYDVPFVLEEGPTLSRYFGLFSDSPMSISETAASINELYDGIFDKTYTEEDILFNILNGFRSLGSCKEFKDILEDINDEVDKTLAEQAS